MEFDLIRYYDTCCCKCGNWATASIKASELCDNKKYASKVLYKYGWRRIDNKTYCPDCVNKTIKQDFGVKL